MSTISLTAGEMNAIVKDFNMPDILSQFPEVLNRLAHLHDVRALAEYAADNSRDSTYHTLRASLLYREARKLMAMRERAGFAVPKDQICGRCGGAGHAAHSCQWHALATRRANLQPGEVERWFDADLEFPTVPGA